MGFPAKRAYKLDMVSSDIQIVTGGAGFIGSNLVSKLVGQGSPVLILDDLSMGGRNRVSALMKLEGVSFRQVDCADTDAISEASASVGGKIGAVWHLAANSDIPAGVSDPRIDLHRTFQTTFGVLEFMRRSQTPVLRFASSSAIYGDLGDAVIHEDIGPLSPISNYGAMKLASEAQISAAVEAFLPRAEIYRFPNVIGAPATHGVIFDFLNKLKANPQRLEVLGNGTQQKSYMHVADLLDAMVHISGLEGGRRLVFNIGPEDEGVTVRFIAECVRDIVAPQAEITYGDQPRGWVGDVPRFVYSTQKLADAGWRPRWSSPETVKRAVEEILAQQAAI